MPWDEFHHGWATRIADQLTPLLPAGFRARECVKAAGGYEIDVATFRRPGLPTATDPGLSDAERVGWQPPPARATVAAVAPELFEVRVISLRGGRQLVGAIELVSPANKDRPDTRDLFTTKVSALLRQDVCVSIVDLVSVRSANLYAELLTKLGRSDPALGPTPPPLYAVSLRRRPLPRGRWALESWFDPMAVGDPLPPLPVWLSGEQRVLLPLEASYEETCRILGIP